MTEENFDNNVKVGIGDAGTVFITQKDNEIIIPASTAREVIKHIAEYNLDDPENIFLKMCRTAKDIQGRIEENHRTVWCDGYNTYTKYSNTQHLISSIEHNFKVEKPFKIPRIDELMEICLEISEIIRPDMDKFMVLGFSFYKFCADKLYIIPNATLEQIWLAFTMYYCYDYIWDFEIRKWVKGSDLE